MGKHFDNNLGIELPEGVEFDPEAGTLTAPFPLSRPGGGVDYIVIHLFPSKSTPINDNTDTLQTNLEEHDTNIN